jgi:hypothetical protein
MHGTMIVQTNRRGRKRKSGKRYPCGQPVREPKPDYREAAAMNPERRHLPPGLRLSEKASSLLGRLNLISEITDEQFEAGRRYERIVRAYHALCCAPRLGQMKPLFRSEDSPDAILDGSAVRVADDDGERTQSRYFDAYEAIGEHVGAENQNRVHKAVNRVAINDHACYPDQLPWLKLGLTALSDHFGLTGGRKSVRTRNYRNTD